jgi:hypothetical protein
MNEVRISGTLTKEPYKSAKGWMSATLAVSKSGTDFKLWVNLYVPANLSKALDGAQKNEAFEVVGELDETKDQQGNKRMQVKAQRINRAAPVNSSDAGFITDEDIPF